MSEIQQSTPDLDLIVTGDRVLVENREIRPASVHVRGGKIVAIKGRHDLVPGVQVIDAGKKLVLPGVVDTHVHVNEPGRTEWEGFATATRAAAAGGITTIFDMPLNSFPPTTTVENLRLKLDAAEGKLYVDCGFHGGVIPQHEQHVRELVAAGVSSFKCFMCYSGIDDFPGMTEEDLHKVMPVFSDTGALFMFHAELPKPDDGLDRTPIRSYLEHLDNYGDTEPAAIRKVVELVEKYGARAHIVHLSCAESVEIIAAAKNRGLPITAETCPHYLALAAEEIPDGATYFKCCPPVRRRANQDALWAGLMRGVLDMVVCDHSPCPPDMKRLDVGSWFLAWGGISSVQLSFPVTFTEAVKRGITPALLMRWMAEAPARLVGLEHRKGALRVGLDADILIFDDRKPFVVQGKDLLHRHKLTPYEGRVLAGSVVQTLLRGQVIYQEGTLCSETARGEKLLFGGTGPAAGMSSV